MRRVCKNAGAIKVTMLIAENGERTSLLNNVTKEDTQTSSLHLHSFLQGIVTKPA